MDIGRTNTELAAAVVIALAIAPVLGVQMAARYLERSGAGFALTCRVLMQPARRRHAVFSDARASAPDVPAPRPLPPG